MIRYLIFPLVIIVIISFINIIRQMLQSSKINGEKKRREADHREYMAAYNTRRQLFGDVYGVSRKYDLYGNEDSQTQNHISSCGEDDEVETDYDREKNRYAVSCCGSFIGYLPPAANDTLSKVSDFKAIVSLIGFTSSDKYRVQVTVFSNE